MKKLSLLLGAVGGAMAGYVFSNSKLREELSNAKDAEAAGKILAKHLKQDGKKVGKEFKELVESDEVQKNLAKAKKYANDSVKKAKEEIKSMVQKGEGALRKEVKEMKGTAKKSSKKGGKDAA